MTTAAQLNNAIVSLDWLHGQQPEVKELTRDWQHWYGRARLSPGPHQRALEFYELRYRAAYARAAPYASASISAQGSPISQTYAPSSAAPLVRPASNALALGLGLGALGLLGLLLLRKG